MRVKAPSPWPAAVSPGPPQVPGTQESSGNMGLINYWNLCISPGVWYNPGPSVWKTQVKLKKKKHTHTKKPRSQSKGEKTLNYSFCSHFLVSDWLIDHGKGKMQKGEISVLSWNLSAPNTWPPQTGVGVGFFCLRLEVKGITQWPQPIHFISTIEKQSLLSFGCQWGGCRQEGKCYKLIFFRSTDLLQAVLKIVQSRTVE